MGAETEAGAGVEDSVPQRPTRRARVRHTKPKEAGAQAAAASKGGSSSSSKGSSSSGIPKKVATNLKDNSSRRSSSTSSGCSSSKGQIRSSGSSAKVTHSNRSSSSRGSESNTRNREDSVSRLGGPAVEWAGGGTPGTEEPDRRHQLVANPA